MNRARKVSAKTAARREDSAPDCSDAGTDRSLIRCVPLEIRLPKATELDLWRRMNRGDRQARDRLAKSQLPWVLTLAGRMSRPGDDVDELAQEGFVGLMQALESFDARRARLSTWIVRPVSWAIRDFQVKNRAIVSRPVNRSQRHSGQWDRAGCGYELVREDHALEDTDPTELIDRNERLSCLWGAIERLPSREQRVLRRLLAGGSPVEVAREMAVSRQRVDQLRDRCVERLREMLQPLAD